MLEEKADAKGEVEVIVMDNVGITTLQIQTTMRNGKT